MNELERQLELAATNPAVRPEFYRLLLRSILFVITPNAPATSSQRVLEKEEEVQIAGWGSGDKRFTPIFTSEQLLEQAVAGAAKPLGYIGLQGADLFRFLSQTNVDAVLNPGSSHGRIFTADEIKKLAQGDFLQPTSPDVASSSREVLLGYPKEEPTDLMAALRAYFASVDTVVEAFLALMVDPAVGPEPRLLVAVRVEGDPRGLINDAAVIAREVPSSTPGAPIDFIVLDKPGILGGHFDHRDDPFYTRRGA